MVENVFAASPTDVKYGGASLKRAAELALEAKEELDGICAHMSWHGNHDQISKTLDKFYTPALMAGSAAADVLWKLIDQHSDTAINGGQFMGDLNGGVSDFVGGGKRG
jgi:hypothetical protein